MGEVCPRRLLTVAKGTPRIMSQEAKVWRRSWKWKSVKPAPSQASLKGVPNIIPPMSLLHRERPTVRLAEFVSPLNRVHSVSLNGSARAFPFFVCFKRINPCVISTKSQVRLSSSPFRMPV